MRCLPLLAASLLFAFAGSSATAAPVDREQVALQRLFAPAPLDASLFARNFLAKIPVSDVQTYVDSYKQRLGAPSAIVKDGFEWALISPKGTIKVDIAFDSGGRISTLLFHDELSAANLAALQRVLAAQEISPDWFEPSYLDDVPTVKLKSLLAGMHAALGSFVRVDTRKGTYVAVFAKGESHAQISVDPDGKIDYLAFSKT